MIFSVLNGRTFPLLDHHQGAAPKLLENRVASNPEFFCEVIRLIYRSKKTDVAPD